MKRNYIIFCGAIASMIISRKSKQTARSCYQYLKNSLEDVKLKTAMLNY